MIGSPLLTNIKQAKKPEGYMDGGISWLLATMPPNIVVFGGQKSRIVSGKRVANVYLHMQALRGIRLELMHLSSGSGHFAVSLF